MSPIETLSPHLASLVRSPQRVAFVICKVQTNRRKAIKFIAFKPYFLDREWLRAYDKKAQQIRQ